MATAKELSLVNTLINEGVTEDGRPSFLRSWMPIRFLGKGNFGEVFEIRRDGERCALKIIAMDDDFIDQYAAEINALARIRGERHAVRIEEYEIIGVDRGAYIQRYMIIRMNLLGKLPVSMDEDSIIRLGLDMCDILAKCHSGTPKILHCDIKPENILVSPDGSFLLSDFGAAKISDKTHNSSGFRGTPLYMSPEMSEIGRGYDNRSDLYSLGITMYALLNRGYPPFCDITENARAIRMRFDGKKLPDIPGASAGMMKILRKVCAADPNRRYRTARELSADLSALAAAREEAAKHADNTFGDTVIPGKRPVRISTVQTKKKPLGIIATATALVAAIVCGVVFIPGLSKKDDNNGTQQEAVSGFVSGTKEFTDDESAELLGQVSDSDKKPAENVSAGDHIYFGSYPQTADGDVQPIEWRVLNVEDDKMLMISEHLLDRKRYNDTYNNVSWETCTLRAWLNNDFYKTAFSEDEQKKLVLAHNTNPDNSRYGTDGGNDTDDYVFCLSIDEVQDYLSNSDDLTAEKTAHADKNGVPGWWWLRSSGHYCDSAAFVDHAGVIYDSGGHVDDVNCIRPAILVSLSD